MVQRTIKVDMRITTADIPSQEVITKDNVPIGINAVVYFQVERAEDALLKIKDFAYAVTQYAQTALRDIVGGVELDTLLTEREELANKINETSGLDHKIVYDGDKIAIYLNGLPEEYRGIIDAISVQDAVCTNWEKVKALIKTHELKYFNSSTKHQVKVQMHM